MKPRLNGGSMISRGFPEISELRGANKRDKPAWSTNNGTSTRNETFSLAVVNRRTVGVVLPAADGKTRDGGDGRRETGRSVDESGVPG